jgi:serine/threonine protein kinase
VRTSPADKHEPVTAILASDARAPGELGVIGDYELIKVLGHGGMGVVYKARQKNLNRMVALKTIRPGVAMSEQALSRFLIEAQSAANLRHPGIVAVYDVGEENGCHYYSMELIEGRDLADLVRDRTLSADEAAKHLLALADAMRYAHDQDILHRDLKPSNVLIDSRGVLKIADFGLAKRMNAGDSQLTQSDSILGTPSYMPPEQASPDFGAVGPWSDVYSLGAILYELLSGRPPFRANSPLETMRLLLTTEPVPLRQLAPSVPRDLETICHKCLDRVAQRRYRSAKELAEELDRFLRQEPILARPIGRTQRLWRWCRRHPLESLLVASLASALLVGSIAVFWQWRRAESNLLTARQNQDRAQKTLDQLGTASDQLLVVVKDWIARLPASDASQRDKLNTALRAYQQLLESWPEDAHTHLKLAETHHRVADIYLHLRDFDQAIVHYKAAITVYERVRQGDPGNVQLARLIADEHDWLGEAYRFAEQLEEAERRFQQAIAEQTAVLSREPSAALRGELARTYNNRALMRRQMGQDEAALADVNRGIELLDEARRSAPAEVDLRQGLARCRINRGMILKRSRQPVAALADYAAAEQLLEQLVRDVDDDREFRFELAKALLNRGNLLFDHRKDTVFADRDALGESFSAFDRARGLLLALADAYRGMDEYRHQLANTYNGLGAWYQVREAPRDAEQAYEQARRLLSELVEESPRSPDLHSRLAIACANLASLNTADSGAASDSNGPQGGSKRKIVLLETAVDHQSRALELAPKLGDYPELLRRHRAALARAHLTGDNHGAFLEQFHALVELRTGTAKDWRGLLALAGRGLQRARLATATATDPPTAANSNWSERYLAELRWGLSELLQSRAVSGPELAADPSLAFLRSEPTLSAILEPISPESRK